MTTTPILYSFRRCPYAMRARLGIWSSGLTVALREVLLRAKPQAMLDASPKGTVPVLVLPDGTIIDESIDIMHWALGRSDPEAIYCGRDTKSDALIVENDGPFKAALDRYKYPDRYGNENRTVNQARGSSFLKELDDRIGSKPALDGDRLMFADYAILPFVRQFAHVDRDWFEAQPWPNVRRWLDTFKQSDRFESIMEKYAPWAEGDEPVLFGRGPRGKTRL